MANMSRKVGLEGVRFISPIGFFPEEQILKNEFMVNISVSFEIETLEDTDELENTVDYSQLYEVCDFYFKQEFKLIETVAHAILDKVVEKYPFLKEVHIKINKLNPPINAEIKNSFIELNYSK
jgi:dihydroneopterin aldolase